MSHTQAELKRMIAKDKEDLKEILDGYRLLPEYQDATDEVKRLRQELAIAEKNQTEIIVDYKEECKGEINLKREDVSYLQDLLNKARSGLNVNEYNQDLVDMFKKFGSGTTSGSYKQLHWVSEFGRFAIFKSLTYQTVAVSWYLYEITEDYDSDIKTYGGYLWKTEGGHWNKKRQKEAIKAMEGFLNKEFFLNLLEELGWKKDWGRDKYRMTFVSPNYDHDMVYIREGEKGREAYEENANKRIYINYLKMPTTDAEAFEMYPELKNYK